MIAFRKRHTETAMYLMWSANTTHTGEHNRYSYTQNIDEATAVNYMTRDLRLYVSDNKLETVEVKVTRKVELIIK